MIDSFQDRYITVRCIYDGFEAQKKPPENMKTVDYWFHSELEHALDGTYKVEENDAAILVLIAKRFGHAINIGRYALTPSLPWMCS